ncbi:hypothetical protein [Nonomuraea sediminis]|uniref:hypothetical protein n=1 Tax=Nonomuraea sediminis TaxID=2835864 RepID=UPI001BDDA3E4|nr:hypothetical protein [Nonomuraea sediminis]
MHEHDDPNLSTPPRPWRRAPYGMGQSPEPADTGPPPSPHGGPTDEDARGADEGPVDEGPVDDGGPYVPMDPRRYSPPMPPGDDGDDGDDGAWYGPDTSRIDWRAVAPVAGVLAAAVGLAIWAAWPDAPTQAQASPTPTPVKTLRYVDEAKPTPLDSGTPFFVTPRPTYTNLLGKTPTASPDPFGALTPAPTPGSTHKPREQAGEGDGRLSVEPDRPAAEQQQEKPRTTKTTKPRSKGDSDRSGATSTGRGKSSSGRELVDKKCDELFPPHKPEFAIRNQACHQMYGSG